VFAQFTDQLNLFIEENILPEIVGDIVGDYLDEFSQKAANLTVIGVGFISITAFALMFTIDRAFDLIWRVRRRRPFAQRFLMYLGMLMLGPVLIGASLTMTSFLVSASLGWTSALPYVNDAVLRLVPVGLTVAAFTLLYYIVPSRSVHPLHALAGGIIAGLLFEAMKRGFALYVANTPAFTMVYGTFATIPIFLLWIYLSWVVTALGAVVTALLPDYRALAAKGGLAPDVEFVGALEIFGALFKAEAAGEVWSASRIGARAGLPLERCEALLETMGNAGWVRKHSGERWTLSCDPAILTVADVYRRFAFVPEMLESRRIGNQELERVLAAAAAKIDAEMSVSIERALFGAEARKSG
jgi:membrane protein